VIIDPNDIAVVVHTCPARLGKLDEIRESVEKSDIFVNRKHPHELFEIAREPEGASNFEKRLHYLSLLCRNARKRPYVLRLEDDIIVNRHIIHNLCTWPALRDPDFAIGLAFVDRRLWLRPQSLDNHETENGLVYRHPTSTPWAQAHLYKSEHLIPAAQCYFEELADQNASYYKDLGKVALAFDWALTRTVGRRGLKVYLHKPSLAQGTEVGDRRALNKEQVPIPHRADDFDLDWRRDG
jgi:hypothetical protein